MTSATFSRKRTMSGRRMRAAAMAATLAGALALTACSGDGGSDSDAAPSPSGFATPSADTGGGTDGGTDGGTGGGSESSAGGLGGSWLATTDGKAVVLMVNGKEAGLFATGGTVCSGTANEEDGMRMIRLKCTDGSKDRAVGMVDSVAKSSLKVTWEGGLGTETYTRSEGGKLPTGLPTAGLGS